MTLAELLKQAGVKEEVISGLPAEVVTTISGHLTEAETKLTTAQAAEASAAELRRLAELERSEINEYVEKYANGVATNASVQAENDALKTYLASLKTQGFDIKMPVGETPKAAVPGSPALGANAVNFDQNKFMSQVGGVVATFVDASNKHMALFGKPLPDSSEALAQEAARARKPLGEYIAEKYKFGEREQQQQKEAYEARVATDVKAKLDDERRKAAEANGGNPNLRSGEPSRNSFVPKIKSDEFHKADGNVPQRERIRRVMENVRRDVAAATA